jgi:flagellar motor switch protein FliG
MSEVEMTGLRKAAVLLTQMGKENAAKILSNLRESEVEELTAEVVRLGSIDAAQAGTVLTEFHQMVTANRHIGQGGLTFARDMLIASVGAVRAGEIVDRLSDVFRDLPFNFLTHVDARQVVSFVQDEHPQTIALVLAHVPSALGVAILSGLAPEVQSDVAHRIAVMDRTSPDVIRQVELALQRKLSTVLQPDQLSTVGGLDPLVDIINRADRSTERMILEGLAGRDPELAELIRSKMFMFEDVVTIDDRAVQLVLRDVQTADLAVALKGVRDDVRLKITSNLSTRAAENLAEEIELLGPVRLSAVEEAQARVVQVIRALEESGQLTINRGEDEQFVS